LAINSKLTAALLLLGAWGLFALIVPGTFIPGPLATLKAALTLLTSKALLDILVTIGRTLTAFFISLMLAIMIALAGQYNTAVRGVIRELMSFIIRIPAIAAVTFFVLLFGTGQLTIYVSVVTMVIPVTVLSISGLYETINPGLTTVNRVYRVPFLRQALYLYLPTLFGAFEATFILSYSLTFKALIMAEFLGGLSGLGYGLMIQRESLDLEKLTAYILIIALVGFVCQKLLQGGLRLWTKRYAAI